MSIKVKINNVRLSYEHIFNPSAFDESQDAKYSATVIIPKDHPGLSDLKKAFMAAAREKFPNAFAGSSWAKGYTCALKDADKDTNQDGEILAERNPEYAGSYILKLDSTRRPVVIDRSKAALTEADGVIYSGCYVNIVGAVAGYEFGKVKKGVKAYLNGVQFVKDGERFGADALNEFDDLDGDEEDDFAS